MQLFTNQVWLSDDPKPSAVDHQSLGMFRVQPNACHFSGYNATIVQFRSVTLTCHDLLTTDYISCVLECNFWFTLLHTLEPIPIEPFGGWILGLTANVFVHLRPLFFKTKNLPTFITVKDRAHHIFPSFLG